MSSASISKSNVYDSLTNKSVQAILELATKHPLYAASTPVRAHRLDQWPILQKQDLHARFSTLRKEMPKSWWSHVYWSPSGGSSNPNGLPTFMVSDVKENHEQRRRLGRQMGGLGEATDDHLDTTSQVLSQDTVALNLFSGSGMYRSLEIFNEFCDEAGATCLPASFTCDDVRAEQMARAFEANTVMGNPPRLVQFAMHLRAQRQQQQQQQSSLQIDRVIWGCEPLAAAKRQLLEDELGVKQFTSVYGSSETGVWAYQPDWLEQGSFVFDPRMVHVEILDADPREHVGKVVVTNLVRRRFPLVRYRTGDMGRIETREHGGRRWHVLVFKGREAVTFTIGADYYSVGEVEESWADAPEAGRVLEWQCLLGTDAQTGKDTLTLCIVINEDDEAKGNAPTNTALVGVLASKLTRAIDKYNGTRFRIEARVIDAKALIRSVGSTKVRKIVDQREQ